MSNDGSRTLISSCGNLVPEHIPFIAKPLVNQMELIQIHVLVT